MSSSSNITNEKNIKKESEVAILSILDKSYYNRNIQEINIEIPSKLISSNETQEKAQNNIITLFNALYNSLINKDHKSFLFCIQQNNEILIEETVKQMNSDCLNKFIEKAVDIFQSNSFYSKMIIPWFQKILKHKKLEIFRKKNIENLKKIQIFIKDKIKCFDSLCILKHKIGKINQIFCDNNKEKKAINNDNDNNNKPVIFEPLLTYYESEDEDEAKNKEIKKNKMEVEGFEEIEKDEEEGENEENINIDNEKEESEEDYIDEEIDNMLMDDNEIIRNKKLEKKEKIEKDELNGEEEDEENENINEEDE